MLVQGWPLSLVLSLLPQMLVMCVQTMCVGGAVGEGTHGVRSSWRPGEAGAGHNAGRLSPGKGKPFAMSHLAIESLLLEARGLLGFEGVVYWP